MVVVAVCLKGWEEGTFFRDAMYIKARRLHPHHQIDDVTMPRPGFNKIPEIKKGFTLYVMNRNTRIDKNHQLFIATVCQEKL